MKPKIFSDFFRVLGSRRSVSVERMIEWARALVSNRGEASGVAIATQLLEAYHQAQPELRLSFLKQLANDFGPDPDRLARAIDRYLKEPDAQTALALHESAESRRQELIRRMNLAPGAIPELVRMREDVLSGMKAHPELALLDADFSHLFASWFNRGFLNLKRIDWSTPAHVLEKIIAYEAVHAIDSWDALRARLLPRDRRCFAFFHPNLPDEPLIFVEVALTDEIPNAIAPLLTTSRGELDPEKASVAVFYSISNCQKGLRGVSFGNFLIKQVVEELSRELPRVKTFVTLSPIPGFADWLKKSRTAGGKGGQDDQARAALQGALARDDWPSEPQTCKTLQPLLTQALLSYLIDAKSRDKPLDPVARFHLGNGARLERVNWLGDVSTKGLRESHGFMVNYLYDLDRIERNHERFANEGEIVTSSRIKRQHESAQG